VSACIYLVAIYIFFKISLTDSITLELKNKWIEEGFDVSQAELFASPFILTIGELLRNVLLHGLIISILVAIIMRNPKPVEKKP